MAGPAHSNERASRRTFRLAFGVTLVFVIAQLINWPLAFVAPVFTAILLQEAAPLSVLEGLKTFGTAFVSIFSGYFISLFLTPFPAVMLLVVFVLLYRFYIFLQVSGANLLAIVSMVLGLIVTPVVVQLLPELGLIAGLGFLADFALAILVAWMAFVLIPAPDQPPGSHHAAIPFSVAASTAIGLAIVVTPLMAGFIVFSWTYILVLVYGALFATAMSSEESAKMGWKSLVANLLFGGGGMLITYELLVMVPSLPFMVVLMFFAILIYAERIFSSSPNAALWASGFFGFMLLLGPALLAENVETGGKLIHRVVQIGLATVYVVFAFRVVDLVKSLFAGLRGRQPLQEAASADSSNLKHDV